jgi:lipopolysaccharide/colanic/teichoic acid biosynthesis glycosyltransferase
MKMQSNLYTNFIKRPLDLLFAFMGLLLALPVIALIFILLLLTGHSKLIFTQKRIGYHEKEFLLYKICTMTELKDASGNLLPDEIRLTAFGRLLRRTSLDELPQLINILLGEMSFIGPRPLLPEYLPRYTTLQRRRHEVKPGISGWAQVNGRNAIGWEKKFELDIYYVKNQSFLLDLKIILLTIKKILFSEGINQQGKATMEPFKGSENGTETPNQ